LSRNRQPPRKGLKSKGEKGERGGLWCKEVKRQCANPCVPETVIKGATEGTEGDRDEQGQGREERRVRSKLGNWLDWPWGGEEEEGQGRRAGMEERV
jgi:hypothetical protein